MQKGDKSERHRLNSSTSRFILRRPRCSPEQVVQLLQISSSLFLRHVKGLLPHLVEGCLWAMLFPSNLQVSKSPILPV